ncbi:TIM-barrel domain-containing protein [Microbacterium sp. Se63.02b]|uniref:TIM-barrel domain-containing protein n=1 Tax=Microbacterium sp. Se63.02b TaxID=2709304 RepID=UPI00191FD5F0|nr:TIM-barrel domain-containing protein [Microbacterium sp. Se63.02b]
MPSVPSGAELRYRFTAQRRDGAAESTRWFSCRVAAWRPGAADTVRVDAASSVPARPSEVEVLDDGERVLRVRFALPLTTGEHVTGFGERFDALDHRGQRLDSMVFEQYKSQGAHRRTYLPMPFAHVVGGAGWGFHVRTSRRVWFDIGASDASRLVVEAETDAVAEAAAIELALYTGAPTEVLDAFLAEVGRPTELPDWVFRLWASGNEWNTQAEVERQMALHREHDIPVGSVVIEAWSDESTFTAFRDARYEVRADGGPLRLDDFDFPSEGAWPDPKGMVDALHESDVRVHLWQIPLMKMRPHPQGQARADADAAIREGVLIRRSPRRVASALPQPRLVVPAGTHARSDRRARCTVVDREAPLPRGGGRHRRVQDRRGRARVGRGPALSRRQPRRRVEQPVPRGLRRGIRTTARVGGQGAGDVQPCGLHGLAGARCVLGGRRELHVGGLPVVDARRALGRSQRRPLLGMGHRRVLGRHPDPELYVRAMAASVFVPIMQYHSEFNHHRLPSRDRTPWNIAERTGTTP